MTDDRLERLGKSVKREGRQERELARLVFGPDYGSCLTPKGIERLADRYRSGVFSLNDSEDETP